MIRVISLEWQGKSKVENENLLTLTFGKGPFTLTANNGVSLFYRFLKDMHQTFLHR